MMMAPMMTMTIKKVVVVIVVVLMIVALVMMVAVLMMVAVVQQLNTRNACYLRTRRIVPGLCAPDLPVHILPPPDVALPVGCPWYHGLRRWTPDPSI